MYAVRRRRDDGPMKRPLQKRRKPRQPLKLAAWRRHRNMTQKALADASGVSQGLISQLENDKTDYTGETLEALAFALGCETVDLIVRDPTDPDAPWSIWETLKPVEKRQALEIMQALSGLRASKPLHVSRDISPTNFSLALAY